MIPQDSRRPTEDATPASGIGRREKRRDEQQSSRVRGFFRWMRQNLQKTPRQASAGPQEGSAYEVVASVEGAAGGPQVKARSLPPAAPRAELHADPARSGSGRRSAWPSPRAAGRDNEISPPESGGAVHSPPRSPPQHQPSPPIGGGVGAQLLPESSRSDRRDQGRAFEELSQNFRLVPNADGSLPLPSLSSRPLAARDDVQHDAGPQTVASRTTSSLSRSNPAHSGGLRTHSRSDCATPSAGSAAQHTWSGGVPSQDPDVDRRTISAASDKPPFTKRDLVCVNSESDSFGRLAVQ
mmetsp:Transcript_95171/g.217938  ORF Transcript_95171/g.217938 Transcript_95171/m.217938 type:complete len:296 (+) Transcript_95171:37-924(+)